MQRTLRRKPNESAESSLRVGEKIDLRDALCNGDGLPSARGGFADHRMRRGGTASPLGSSFPKLFHKTLRPLTRSRGLEEEAMTNWHCGVSYEQARSTNCAELLESRNIVPTVAELQEDLLGLRAELGSWPPGFGWLIVELHRAR